MVVLMFSSRAGGVLLRLFFSGDNDDTVACPGAPDGGSGGVFQDCDAFHVVRVQVVDIALVGKVVDYNQRGFCACYGADAADGEGWLEAAVVEIEACDRAVESVEYGATDLPVEGGV